MRSLPWVMCFLVNLGKTKRIAAEIDLRDILVKGIQFSIEKTETQWNRGGVTYTNHSYTSGSVF